MNKIDSMQCKLFKWIFYNSKQESIRAVFLNKNSCLDDVKGCNHVEASKEK
jgi:hypothetical protein